MSRKSGFPSPSEQIRESLKEILEAVSSPGPLHAKLTVREVEVAEPRIYDAPAVRKLRQSMKVSQGVFAKLIGVSPQLVENWEQGISDPSLIARRVLDFVRVDPTGFVSATIRRRRGNEAVSIRSTAKRRARAPKTVRQAG